MKRTHWFGLLAIAWANIAPAAAQTPLFADDAPLQITVNAPFRDLVNKAKNPKPYPATLSMAAGAGPAQNFSIQINARGKTRRTGDYCSFPPILLTFNKADVQSTIFRGQRELKLVTYCRKPPDYEQRIVLEYLAYRLFNLITPMSYRVRATKVTYHSTDGGEDVTRFGFVIEDIDDVAERNKRKKLKSATHEVAIARLDTRAAARAAVFEYLVGNLDWDFTAGPAGDDCCHNSRHIAAPGAAPATATAVVPVPYDFDWSGFVDSPYAGPPEGIQIHKVTERFYRGYCAHNSDIPAVVEEFRAQRGAMTALINGDPNLTANFKTKTAKFLDGFFVALEDPERVQSRLIARCR